MTVYFPVMRRIIHRAIGSSCVVALTLASFAAASFGAVCAPTPTCPMETVMTDSHCAPVASLKADCCVGEKPFGEPAVASNGIPRSPKVAGVEASPSPVVVLGGDAILVWHPPPPDPSVAIFTRFQALLI